MKSGGPRPVKAKITEPARAKGTVYQNTTGRPIVCIVTASLLRVNVDQHAYVIARVEDVTPPVKGVSSPGLGTSGPPQSIQVELVFAVPPGYYYKVDEGLGAGSLVTVISWFEVEF